MSLNRPPTFNWTDHSYTIQVGGTSQQLMPANGQRVGVIIQNLHATEAMWVKFGGGVAAASTPGSYQIAAGATLQIPEYCDPGQIVVVAATATHPYSAAEWGI